MTLYKNLFILLILFTGSQTFAQNDASIKVIRQEYNRVNALKLTREHFDYEKASCVEEGKVDYYLEGKTIVKITESGFIGDGGWTTTYYYKAGQPFFCLDVIEGGPAAGDHTRTERRIYIREGRAIRVLEGSKPMKDENISGEHIQRANNFYKAYTTKKFGEALCG
ncbi:hypothetical protein [Taibaiella chishuiensis]|uniref:Uncharacterized protein n=1 Tax=Taibaiella chishuiensis TaxID=1434707 RepID=A0A2P8CT20_9BACT|nr:hypothetical protein [Taibaiella chishuiensis]PSK88113.1 hypothetical protein B0I18_1157 [Taibaiella chishuiensis]